MEKAPWRRPLQQARFRRNCVHSGTGWRPQACRWSLFDRGAVERGEQQAPDRVLQLQMLRDFADYNGDPGIVVLLTGDGHGFYDGAGFHADVNRMYRRGWRVEILSWANSCSQRMREWVEENGIFVALDDHYEAVTFLEPSSPDYPTVDLREPAELDLSCRPMAAAPDP